MAEKALYRKLNDGSHNNSTYHKKDGTNVRAKLKAKLQAMVCIGCGLGQQSKKNDRCKECGGRLMTDI